MDYRSDKAPIRTPFGVGPRLVLQCVRPVRKHGETIIDKGDVTYGWQSNGPDGPERDFLSVYTPGSFGMTMTDLRCFEVLSEDQSEGHDA